MELKDNSNSEESKSGGGSSTELDDDIEDYCEICRGHVGHECWDCPYKSKGIGWGCIECYGPCKKEDGDPSEHWSIEMVKQCVVCGNMGNHWGDWADDCPYRSDAQVDDAGTSDHDGLGF